MSLTDAWLPLLPLLLLLLPFGLAVGLPALGVTGEPPTLPGVDEGVVSEGVLEGPPPPLEGVSDGTVVSAATHRSVSGAALEYSHLPV